MALAVPSKRAEPSKHSFAVMLVTAAERVGGSELEDAAEQRLVLLGGLPSCVARLCKAACKAWENGEDTACLYRHDCQGTACSQVMQGPTGKGTCQYCLTI